MQPNTWNFNSCQGCEDCNCGIGSESQQCDLFTGVCTCMPGVEGEKCDKCQAGHWNYGPSGCEGEISKFLSWGSFYIVVVLPTPWAPFFLSLLVS